MIVALIEVTIVAVIVPATFWAGWPAAHSPNYSAASTAQDNPPHSRGLGRASWVTLHLNTFDMILKKNL